MGSTTWTWFESRARIISFAVTEDCSLACKYCYITGQNRGNAMSLELAKAAVDFILSSSRDVMPEDSVIWDFIGREPFSEIEFVDRITDYISLQMYELSHRWFGNHRFRFSSDGTLYDSPPVQRYLLKNSHCINVGLSAVGDQMDDQKRNVPLWSKQFPNGSATVTFPADDLRYLKDSIVNLWDLGVKDVNLYVVFTGAGKPDNDFLLETQLMELADYIIDNDLNETRSCSFFSDLIGHPLTEERLRQNWCNTGKMLAIDYLGALYPCMRFMGCSPNKRNSYVIGSIYEGLDQNKLRAAQTMNTHGQSSQSCLDCQVASGCAWYQRFDDDGAIFDPNFERAIYLCQMHKARVRANDYYWAKLRTKNRITRANSGERIEGTDRRSDYCITRSSAQ